MATFLKSLNRNVFGFQDDNDTSNQLNRNNDTSSGYSYGFQVLRNKNPDLAVEPWFDYIVGINGRIIDNPSPTLFATEVRNCAGASVEFLIQSTKGSTIRTLLIPVPSPPSLDLTLQWSPTSLGHTIWHITSILPSSPAYHAGLQPQTDYILGSPSAFLSSETAMGELAEDYLGRELVLYVYNTAFDVVREVKITPNQGWGGEGLLGCELGYGVVHRLPRVEEGRDRLGPGETLFDITSAGTRPSGETSHPPFDTSASQPLLAESGQPTSQLQDQSQPPINASLSPPPMTTPSAPNPALPSSTRPAKPKARNSAKYRAAFNDVFAEGEAKSKEEDFTPSRSKTGTPVAPPPKMAGAGDSAVAGPPKQMAKTRDGAPAEEGNSFTEEKERKGEIVGVGDIPDDGKTGNVDDEIDPHNAEQEKSENP